MHVMPILDVALPPNLTNRFSKLCLSEYKSTTSTGTAGHAAENESNAIKFRRRMRPEFLRLKPQPIKSSHAALK